MIVTNHTLSLLEVAHEYDMFPGTLLDFNGRGIMGVNHKEFKNVEESILAEDSDLDAHQFSESEIFFECEETVDEDASAEMRIQG